MTRRLIDVRGQKPLLDVASYARRGPGRRDYLSHDEVELIERTVRRTPEVMVKVLNRGGQDLKAIRRHLAYLTRGGDLEVETDDGQPLSGVDVDKNLLEGWDLDLDEYRRKMELEAWPCRRPAKLVHKVMFSMPAGTPPGKVLAAVKNFAREEFALKHRYAMVLHVDEPHPHVHMVLKAVSEQGVRLNIRKTTLREWRRGFARHLRALGVPANATERAVRGQNRPPKLDGIYRAERRGESHHARDKAESVAQESLSGELRIESGRATLLETRKEVDRGWAAVGNILVVGGNSGLAAEVRRFAARMPPPRTERELIAETLRTPTGESSRPDDAVRPPASTRINAGLTR